MITELTELQLEEARLWCGVFMCVHRLRRVGKCQLKPEADPEFNRWALSDAAAKLMGTHDAVPGEKEKSVQKFEANCELVDLLMSEPVRAALGVKLSDVPSSHAGWGAKILTRDAVESFLASPKRRKLAPDEKVVGGDVCYYKSSDTYFFVAAEWVGRTLATWPKGRQPYCIWREE